MDDLRRYVQRACESAEWFEGIPGLYLNIDKLSSLGADGMFLQWWEHGRPLEAKVGTPVSVLNHRSVLEHSE